MNIFRKNWMTQREFKASKEGLNIVFGAVLGFVLAGTEDMRSDAYSIILITSAVSVITIFYIGASLYRISYATIAILYVLVFPFAVRLFLDVEIPTKLQPTLLIWTVIAIVLEFAPRGAASAKSRL